MTSLSEEPLGQIIKSDRAGRVHYTKDYKRDVLAAFANSGMSAAAFAEQCGVKYPTFSSWVAKERKKGPQGDQVISATMPFMIAELGRGEEASDAALELELPSGVVARIKSQEQLPLLKSLLQHLSL